MLDPWIIEEIKRREERNRSEQPVIQIPVHGPEPVDRGSVPARPKKDDGPPRGVEIIDLGQASAYGW